MICPRCGTINPEGQERCTRCRGSLAPRPPREQRVPTSTPGGRPASEAAGDEVDAGAEAWVAAPAPAAVTTTGGAEGADAGPPPVPAAAGGSGTPAPSAAPAAAHWPPPDAAPPAVHWPPPDAAPAAAHWPPPDAAPPHPGSAWPPPGALGPPPGGWPPPPPGSQPLPHPWGPPATSPPATSPPPGWQHGLPPAPPNGATTWRPRPNGVGAIPNYLGWSILCTLFFFTPAGAAGVISSIVARRRATAGDLEGAFRASRFARTCCWVSLVVGLVGYLLLISGVIKLPSSGV